MSDDTPTQRFPEPGDDTPTQRFDAALTGGEAGAPAAGTAPVATAEGEELADEKKKSRGLLIGLIALGAALLIAIIVLLVVLFTSGADGTPSADPTTTPSRTPSATPSVTPTATDTPSATPTPTPTETQAPPPPPPPPAQTTKVNSFNVSNTTVTCNTQAPNPSDYYISFSWSTSNVNQVYFGVNTNDASAAPLFTNLPPSGNSQDDFPAGYENFEYPCPTGSVQYTITAVGPNGQKDSRSVTVTNNGDPG